MPMLDTIEPYARTASCVFGLFVYAAFASFFTARILLCLRGCFAKKINRNEQGEHDE